jgi:hypothetical protein
MGICDVARCNKEVWYIYYYGDEIHMICENHNMNVNEGKGKELKFKSGYIKKKKYLSDKYIKNIN